MDKEMLHILVKYLYTDNGHMNLTYIDWDYMKEHNSIEMLSVRYDTNNSFNCMIVVDIIKFNEYTKDFYKNYIKSKLNINKYEL